MIKRRIIKENQKIIKATQINKGNKAFKNGPLYTNKDSLTNGHWLLKKNYIPKNLQKNIATYKSIPKEHLEFWDKKKISNSKICKIKYEIDNTYVFKISFNEEIIFNKMYILFFQKWIKYFNIRAFDKESISYIYSGNALIGLLMPIKQ